MYEYNTISNERLTWIVTVGNTYTRQGILHDLDLEYRLTVTVLHISSDDVLLCLY